MSDLKAHQVISAVPFLESLGFRFHLDFDEQVQIHYPPELTPEAIATAVGQFAPKIAGLLKYRSAELRRRHFGGPMDGKPHNLSYWSWRRPVYNIGRGRWAAYVVDREGRAIYVGEATSQKKAKQLSFEQAVARGYVMEYRRPEAD